MVARIPCPVSSGGRNVAAEHRRHVRGVCQVGMNRSQQLGLSQHIFVRVLGKGQNKLEELIGPKCDCIQRRLSMAGLDGGNMSSNSVDVFSRNRPASESSNVITPKRLIKLACRAVNSVSH
ncbi:MAG: hypothetical protein R3C56_35040 [Pirellulaceae bacterium]